MRFIENETIIPEELIALDEELLTRAESGREGETLRFWEAKEYFIVMGRSGKTEEECFLDNCSRDGIRILRRVSGGGTVLQGPGCLNYSAVMAYGPGETRNDAAASYGRILNRLSSAFNARGCNLDFLPISDLVLNNKKVSGNAQARKRRFFLHHGTLLYAFDIKKVPLYLKHPPKEPKYRKNRSHTEFLANIPLSAGKIREVIKKTFLG